MQARRHIVICGWNDNGRRLVGDLLLTDTAPTVRVVSPRALQPANTRIQRVDFVVADPSTAAGLRAVEVEKADIVVILADVRDGRSPQDADARTILTGLAIEQLRPEVHTIAELLNPDNIFHAKNAGVDEVLISGAYTGAMLAQAVQSPGVLAVYRDLFQSGSGSRLRKLLVPAALHGKSVRDATVAMYREHGVLIGYRRAGAVSLRPPAGDVLQADDLLLFIQQVPSP